MKAYCLWMDHLPKIVKILLCLPIVNILWGIYRIFSVFTKFNIWRLLLGILWFFCGPVFLWIVDLIWMLLFGHILWFKG